MITNIDDNMAVLMDKLEEWELADNTVLIFMTDNGSAFAAHNNKMRGKKATVHEGGTRVPFFIRWPGKIHAAVDVDRLTRHVDVFPTLATIAGADVPASLELDGRNLLPLIQNPNTEWPGRNTFFHNGRWNKAGAEGQWGKGVTDPDAYKYQDFAIRNERWRLVDKDQLYDIAADPMEQNNVIAEHPEVAQSMLAEYDAWWDAVRPRMINEDASLDTEKPFVVQFEKQKTQQGIPDWQAPKL
jgi:arylsulfatase